MITVFQTCNSNSSMPEWSCNSRDVSRIHNRGPSTITFPSPLSLSSHSLPSTSLHSLPSTSLRSRLPLFQLGCLPQRVWEESGRQTLFGAFWAKMLLVTAILNIYSPKFTNKFDKFIINKKYKRLIFFLHQRGAGAKLTPYEYCATVYSN